jgi:mRNA interferase RelE/StbE
MSELSQFEPPTPAYRVKLEDAAIKALKKMDGSMRRLILSYIEKRLAGCRNPRAFGKALSHDHRGEWRYRVGSYRLLAHIDDEKITIYIVKIGDRRDVYEN